MGLVKLPSGTWMPAWVPESSLVLSVLLVLCSAAQSLTTGYDGSMLNGVNILPQYTNYFQLSTGELALNTCSVYIGGALAPLCTGYFLDRLGRRMTLLWSTCLMVVGVILQTAATSVPMFLASRIVLGFGNSIAGAAGAVYLSETFKATWRAWGVGLYNDNYYVGGLIAAGLTLGTANIQNTWAWRLPSLFQGVFSVICIIIIPFIPESPRWLEHKGLHAEAQLVLARVNANGDSDDPVVLLQHQEIVDQLAWEQDQGQRTSWRQMFTNRSSRKRLLIAVTPAIFSVIAGYPSGYYLGTQLENVGVTSTTAQLQVNVVLNIFALACALFGTQLCARWGRKPVGILTQGLCTFFMLVLGILSKEYALSTYKPGVYGAIACIFLFTGSYSIGWTPLLFLYPPEILNYSIRANGMAFCQFANNAIATVFLYAMPIGLDKLGWKIYLINVGWDVVLTAIVALYWVETKGKTLEEVDAIFDGIRHSNMPELEDLTTGKVDGALVVQQAAHRGQEVESEKDAAAVA
ncbi:putative hexose carrier protein [Kockovaella imperatae]|uniref:Putative hexose carrier protein n=1 Tax=Kockovaella imperatae TaxID=4999 RepID=A0A1Y1UA01_9TREE|nr:putative hexose carrier protein [Kockovaella imperatae]ORX34853.1 putative hexose carrier protein [Kockovaella imperatae]